MNQKTLRAELGQIDPNYTIRREPLRLIITAAGKTISIGSGNALGMLTREELRRRIERAAP